MMSEIKPLSRRSLLRWGAATGLVAGLAGCLGGDDDTDEEPETEDGASEDGDYRPVVFVHGSSGSATQFESQAMRFASNGYAEDRLFAYEYDTSVEFDENETEVLDGLESFLDAVRDATGADDVDVLGHSRGTRVMHRYLDTEERADPVANYVNIDGATGDSPPGGVSTLAVWATYGIGARASEMGGAENVTVDQSHIEVATSAETFGAIYEFLTGEEPETTSIEPEPVDEVTLAGRAAYFPVNTGIEDATLEVYEVDAETGERLTDDPHATPTLESDGSWGPIDADGEAFYEFALSHEGGVNHFYRQPALRSNGFVRLLTAVPGTGVDQLIERDDEHTALVVNRNKEWWGGSDAVSINDTEILTEATAPRDDWISSLQVFDAGTDGETTVDEPIPTFEDVAFLTGIDVHIPAADPPDDTVTVSASPRDGEVTREFAVRNWASDEHRVSVQFPDHIQTR